MTRKKKLFHAPPVGFLCHTSALCNSRSASVGLGSTIFLMPPKTGRCFKSPLAPQPSYREKTFRIRSRIGHGWPAAGQELLQTELTPYLGGSQVQT